MARIVLTVAARGRWNDATQHATAQDEIWATLHAGRFDAAKMMWPPHPHRVGRPFRALDTWGRPLYG